MPTITTPDTPDDKITALRQTWGFTVDYITQDGEERTISASFVCPRMDTVFRYVQRKFARIAKKIVNIDVCDHGYMERGTRVELVDQEDGSITAHAAKDNNVVATEKALVPLAIMNPYGINTPYTYVPPTPKEVFPALDTYPVFSKVVMPVTLHDYAGENKFKAKFYEVFPREK